MTAGAPSSFLTSVSVGAAQTITGDKTFSGTSTFSGAVVMSGGQTLDSLTVSGDTTLGDAATDGLTISATVVGDVTLRKEAAHVVSVGASTTSNTAGGALTVRAGAGGATNANGGALALDAGAKAGSGTDGAITIGATNAESVALGRTGKTTTVTGALAVTQGSTLTGSVGVGGAAAASAILTATSTTQGFLPPRMTGTQRDAIASPAAGLMVYNSTTNKLNFYNGSAWEVVTSA